MFPKPFVSFFKRTVSCGSFGFCAVLSVLLSLALVASAQPQAPTSTPSQAAVVPATPQNAVVEGPTRIAVILPLSGPHASTGDLLQQGYTLGKVVLKETVLPNVEVQYFDCGNKDMAQLVKGQVASWKPDVIVGPYTSEEALALDAVAKELNLPVVTPVATIDKLN